MTKRIAFIIIAAIFIIFAVALIFSRAVTKPKAVVAFVIDDWGYNKNNVGLILEIKRPVTVAILPNLRYSEEIAREIKKGNKPHDIILHLPLESKSNVTPEPNTIRCDMEEKKILSILRGDLESMPGIIGVSNHQGSRATRDKKVMKIILGELKKKKLFFLDSLTTPDSACRGIAGRARLKFAERDVFLDLTAKKDLKEMEFYVKRQIQKLARIALEQGSAIAIGHDKAVTLKAIKNSIPELEAQGIKIVPLKELAR